MTYSVGVTSIGVDSKPNKFMYAMLHKSYSNLEIELEDLMLYISEGRSYRAWLNDEGGFVKASAISIDLEGGPAAAIESATQIEFCQQYGALAYTTMSNSPTDPRCRIVFLLDNPLVDPDEYRDTADAIATMWPKTVVDPQTSQPTRAFLGNPHGTTLAFGNVLPLEVASALCHALRMQRKLAKQPAPSSQPAPGEYTGPKRAPAFLLAALNELANTPEGGRAVKCNKVAFMFGKLAVAPGHMAATTAESIIVAAALQCGLPETEARTTTQRALRQGMSIGQLHQS